MLDMNLLLLFPAGLLPLVCARLLSVIIAIFLLGFVIEGVLDNDCSFTFFHGN